MKEKRFKLSVFTENMPGMLSRITIIFTRRKINIESLNVSESEVKGISRFKIVVHTSEEQIIKITKQLEKQVDVLKANYYSESDMLLQGLEGSKFSKNTIN
ncbi:MAG: acetolactate synthase small subunit [Crocinitomicaceae bacterium]|nr:acetolactate synthase small subunit [Flavobacteriales bacterium]NQZ34866.1 acetolactate synthase small subunit [Crocinitomicaceae bacterium]